MSVDDSDVDYSSTNWQARYNEVADMLEQTRSELDEFHVASKELEAELECELQRTERAQKDLMVKVSKAESEREEWKSKFMSLQTTHNTTSTSLQRELDQFRHDHQQIKIQFRELEMGNDDLERNERAVSSSLADVESKYQRALEEKILLEHELLDKASLEEECQRLRDDLRDAVVEASILQDKLAEAAKIPVSPSPLDSQDDLLRTPPPGDLLLSELDPTDDTILTAQTTPKALPSARHPPSRFNPSPSRIATPSTNGISHNPASPSIPLPRRTPLSRNSSVTSSTSTSMHPKNKGVQMVSEMRARVKNLEQRIHTKVPRLHMGSIGSRANGNLASSTYSGVNPPAKATNKAAMAKSGWDGLGGIRRSADTKRSTESENKPGTDSAGWVLIMEDSPSPQKAKNREKRHASSPAENSPMPFRPHSSTAYSRTSPTYKPHSLAQSIAPTGLRRPGSRLSGASSVSSATTSSITTPTSRPSTPTLLPIPSGGGLKRSTVTLPQTKRSSLGATINQPPSKTPRARPTTMPPLPSGRRSLESGKSLPSIPSTTPPGVTVRSSKLAKSGGGALSKSRIGRPSGGGPRRSFDGPPLPEHRPRSNSNAINAAAEEEEIDETEMF